LGNLKVGGKLEYTALVGADGKTPSYGCQRAAQNVLEEYEKLEVGSLVTWIVRVVNGKEVHVLQFTKV